MAGTAAAAAPTTTTTSPSAIAGRSGDEHLAAALARTLRCPVCLDVLTDPLVAPCGHAACASCARAAIEAAPACPTCRAPTDATALVPCTALQQVSWNCLLSLFFCFARSPARQRAEDGTVSDASY